MTSSAPQRASLRLLSVLGCLACAGAPALTETVTLQQGADGYAGCTTATLWAPDSKAADTAGGALYLRGAKNHLLLRFDLPQALKDKKLARARLEVFLPQAKNLKMICEILSREVTEGWSGGADWKNAAAGRPWTVEGGTFDTKTDYQVGRPAGATDSYSLWEYQGQYFPHRYRFLGVPEGGKWIDFDVTPLVRKWLADPKANFGVALAPINQADTRFPCRADIDIPSSASPDAARRPRLVLDLEPLPKPYLVGMTHTLDRYCDRDTRYRFFGPFLEKYQLEMARNEYEGLQVMVYPLAEPLNDVVLELSDLTGPGGAKIAKEDIRYHRLEVFRLHPNGKVRDWYFHGKNFDLPDPLIWDKPADLPVHQSTPFWVVVRTRPDTKAGLYKGKVAVKPANAPPRELELAVKVWDYKIPEKWNFQTMGQTVWDSLRKAYGTITPEMKRKYIDFLLDHRFNPTEQYAPKLSPDEQDIPYCCQRGANTIYLNGTYRHGNVESLKKSYDKVKQLGLIDRALVYIGDETSKWDEMRRNSDEVRLACPELMIMIGGSFPRAELEGVIDIFDPQIDLSTNKVYSLPANEMRPLIAKAQGRGEKFFWYVAAGPMLPCPNVQIEDPLIAARVLFWMTWKFGVTGFEYYCYNLGWEYQPKYAGGKPWPQTPFSPRAFKGEYNGDGNLFYPGPDGPFSSVRFENIRDGIEDWESHYVLRDCVEALEAKAKKDPALAARAGALLAKAKPLLAVPDEVCKMNFADWTWEPQVLLKARRDLGDTIDEFARLVAEPEILAVRDARKPAELLRQRAMLKQRAEAARAAQATRPAAAQPAKN